MIYCWRNMIYGVRRMIYLRCKHDMISVPTYASAYIIRDSGYHSVSYIIRDRRERISLKKAPSQRLGAFFWCERWDSNPHGVTTRTSNVLVYHSNTLANA